MSNFIEDAPCLYFVTNDLGIITDVNNTLCQKLKYKKDELVGAPVEKIFTIATRIFYQTHLFPMLKMQGFVEEIFFTLQTKNKEHIPILTNANHSRANNGMENVFIGIVVQNRKKFEDELVKARKLAEDSLQQNTALQNSQKLLQKNMEESDLQLMQIKQQHNELKQFNHAITHDLQEPLRKLTFLANLLLDKETHKIKASVEETTNRVIKVLDKLNTILNGLQQYSWLGENKLTINEVQIETIIKEVSADLEKEFPSASTQIIVENPVVIHADVVQFKILLNQIFTNSIKFRKKDQPVKITVSAAEIQKNQFQNIAGKYKFEKFIKIDIKDNGVGYDSKFTHTIFDLFKRLHNESGPGIGLSLAKRIVDNHNGLIKADSDGLNGTIITIFLPFSPSM